MYYNDEDDDDDGKGDKDDDKGAKVVSDIDSWKGLTGRFCYYKYSKQAISALDS